jgi:hypothetical protein
VESTDLNGVRGNAYHLYHRIPIKCAYTLDWPAHVTASRFNLECYLTLKLSVWCNGMLIWPSHVSRASQKINVEDVKLSARNLDAGARASSVVGAGKTRALRRRLMLPFCSNQLLYTAVLSV